MDLDLCEVPGGPSRTPRARSTTPNAKTMGRTKGRKQQIDRLRPTCRSATSSSVAALSPPGRFSAMYWISMPNWVPQSPCHTDNGFVQGLDGCKCNMPSGWRGRCIAGWLGGAAAAQAAQAALDCAAGSVSHAAAFVALSMCVRSPHCLLIFSQCVQAQPLLPTDHSQCGSGAARRRRRTRARGRWCRQ